MTERLHPTIEHEIQARYEALYSWLEKNKPLISSSDRVKLTINMKGSHVVGEITQFPE